MQGVRAQDRVVRDDRGVQQGPQAPEVQALPGRTFRSVSEVAQWAFAVVELSAARVSAYVPTVPGTGERMTPLEVRGQAAMVIASIMALPDEQADYMVATYAWRDVVEALERLQLRAQHHMPPSRPDLTAALIERHILSVRRMRVEGLRLIAARHSVGYRVARTRDHKVRAWLGTVWMRAEATLHERWSLTGLIQPSRR